LKGVADVASDGHRVTTAHEENAQRIRRIEMIFDQ
jgi:hypothetical protein